VTGAWAGAWYGWRGSWLVAGRADFWGALATWVGVGSSSPGTQPPCAMQVLIGSNICLLAVAKICNVTSFSPAEMPLENKDL